MDKLEVIVYKSTVCGGCDTVINFLKQNGITPIERNIETNDEYAEEHRQYGYMSVPVVVTNDDTIKPFAGFDLNGMNQIIEASKI